MGITADILADWDAALAALAWQNDMGVDEALMDAPQSAYDLPARAEWQNQGAPQAAPVQQPLATVPKPPAPSIQPSAAQALPDAAIAAATLAAGRCQNLDDLRAALAQFDHLDIKKGARDMVFGTGHPNADILVLSDPPNREEERAKAPFAGEEGVLFDKMFAAIGFGRGDPTQALYMMPALPWRTPQDRPPTPGELAIIRPFVAGHIALISPKIVILMGNAALQLGMNSTGLRAARGIWGQAFGLRAMPMLTPQHLLQNPADKREAWADLLAVKAALS